MRTRPFTSLASRSALTTLVALVTMSSAGACSSSDPETGSGSSGAAATACEKDTRKDIYTAGLAKQGGGLTVAIVASTPSPPKKGANTMTLTVVDGAGTPIDGARVAVTPWMPDHAHGSALQPVATSVGGGRYDVTKLYYPMAGLWEVTVSVQPAGAPVAQEVTFKFCFDG